MRRSISGVQSFMPLNNQRSGCPSRIIFGLFARANEFDADSALANVRFEDERNAEIETRANFVE